MLILVLKIDKPRSFVAGDGRTVDMAMKVRYLEDAPPEDTPTYKGLVVPKAEADPVCLTQVGHIPALYEATFRTKEDKDGRPIQKIVGLREVKKISLASLFEVESSKTARS